MSSICSIIGATSSKLIGWINSWRKIYEKGGKKILKRTAFVNRFVIYIFTRIRIKKQGIFLLCKTFFAKVF